MIPSCATDIQHYLYRPETGEDPDARCRTVKSCDEFTRLAELSEVKALLHDIFLVHREAQTPPSTDEEKRSQDAGTTTTVITDDNDTTSKIACTAKMDRDSKPSIQRA